MNVCILLEAFATKNIIHISEDVSASDGSGFDEVHQATSRCGWAAISYDETVHRVTSGWCGPVAGFHQTVPGAEAICVEAIVAQSVGPIIIPIDHLEK